MQAQTSGKQHRYYKKSLRPDGRMATRCGRLIQPRSEGDLCKRCEALEAEDSYRSEIDLEVAQRRFATHQKVAAP